MNRDEFMGICSALGYPTRGWQKAAVEKAEQLGHKLSQPTISQILTNPDKSISAKTAYVWRALNDAVASGNFRPGASKPLDQATCAGQPGYKDPDDDLSDDQIMDDIGAQFDLFEECIEQVVCGERRGVIVSGPPGSGKSHAVAKFEDRAKGEYVPITGSISPPELYRLLHKIKDNGCAAFDDCDDIFKFVEGLNLLKGALDIKPPGTPNMISWLKMTKGMVDDVGDDLPKTFDFQGRILFMTNKDFEKEIEKGTNIAPHLKALCDRTGYMTLGLHTRRRLMLRIKQVVRDSNIMSDNGIDNPITQMEIIQFIEENKEKWRALNLRLVAQLCEYRKSLPSKWTRHAKALLMKNK